MSMLTIDRHGEADMQTLDTKSASAQVKALVLESALTLPPHGVTALDVKGSPLSYEQSVVEALYNESKTKYSGTHFEGNAALSQALENMRIPNAPAVLLELLTYGELVLTALPSLQGVVIYGGLLKKEQTSDCDIRLVTSYEPPAPAVDYEYGVMNTMQSDVNSAYEHLGLPRTIADRPLRDLFVDSSYGEDLVTSDLSYLAGKRFLALMRAPADQAQLGALRVFYNSDDRTSDKSLAL